MPKAFDKTSKITYPVGCKELSEELNIDELLKRLKILARSFQDMGQDENNQYKQIAIYLASEFFLDHSNKDVRLLVACCIADVFRIFAPDAPYTDAEQLKGIFMFLTQQLQGLNDPEAASFKRYFYLLENLAWVKSFNICIELDDSQVIFCQLYRLMFQIVNEKHSNKVISFMLDMMSPVIREADSVSQELLDIILINIIEPHKTQNRHAYNLAKSLIKRTDSAIEPYIQAFFNSALMLGKTSNSNLSGRLYDLIYELNQIASSVLLAVLPQLEFKLKSNDATERKEVTKLLAKMFSNPDSDLAPQNKQLWICFLGRFNDIDVSVRRTCVQAAQDFIINQPELIKDIAEPLKQRQHDPDENVRIDVVQAIVLAAKKDFNCISDDLLTCVKERTLDKKYKIRKEALIGLGQIYKRCMQCDATDKSTIERVAWIKNKILHAYYQSSLDDKVLVERILNNSLVPYGLEPEDRMQRLYHLYGTVDDHSVRALHEIFKTQLQLRKVLRGILEMHQRGVKITEPTMVSRVTALSRGLPDPSKALEYIKKFNQIVSEDNRIRGFLIKMTSPDCTCKKAEECVKEVLKKMGNAIPQNYLYGNVKMLMERVAPVMIDTTAINALMRYIDDAVSGIGELCDDIPKPIESGMKLLLMLAGVFPGTFQSEQVFTQLLTFVKHDDDIVSDMTMEVFRHVGIRLEQNFPKIYTSLLPVLQKMVKIGTPKQAKHAIRCIDALCKNKDKIFSQIFEHLQKNMDLDSPYFLSSLVAIGHITQICPDEFSQDVKGIVAKFIVKELLMQDRVGGQGRKSAESWCRDDLVSEETNAKMQALKMMVRWLLGIKTNASNSVVSTLRLLYTMVLHEGDLMEKGEVNKAEMARLRLQAACCTLKLSQEPLYADLITPEQFQTVSLLLNDPCYQVRLEFAQRLHKGLILMKLPLQYLSIFCLAANDPLKERRAQIKQFLLSSINKRREYLKTSNTVGTKLFSLLPDYVLPYAIHLLAHDPELVNNEDVSTLKNIRECLWFIMEPLIMKCETYSYSFYRKLIENIKQTKDKQCPDNMDANKKLYAVCDLALGLVMTKTANFILKDYPADPVLPAKLFTQADRSYSNTKSYLPKELQITQPVKKPIVPGLSPLCPPAVSTTATKADGSPDVSENEESMSETSSTSPTQKKSFLPTSSSSKNISFGFNSGKTPSPQQSKKSTNVRVAAAQPTSSAGAKQKAPVVVTRTEPKKDGGPTLVKSPRREAAKEDRPPATTTASTTRTSRTASAAPKKSQGKITDYVSPRPALASKNNKGTSSSSHDSSGSSSRDSPKSTPEKGSKDAPARRETRAASQTSPTLRNTRKRSADEQAEVAVAKKPRGAQPPAKRAVRDLSADLSGESDSGSTRSSQRKGLVKGSSPVKRRPGRPRRQSSESETVPSPSTPSSKTSPSSPSPKKKVTTTANTRTATNAKKNYPIRNTRRGTIQNGTSDGEDGTPESSQSGSTPQKTRSVVMVRAIEEQSKEEKLNVKRKVVKRRR